MGAPAAKDMRHVAIFAKTTSKFSMAADGVPAGLDWRAFSVLDPYKNERGIPISFGDRHRTAIFDVRNVRDVHLRHCRNRNSLGGALPVSRNNGQPQPAKALAGAVSHLDCGCSFRQQRNFPQRAEAFARRCISGRVVTVAFCFVAVDTSAAVRGEGISVLTLSSPTWRKRSA